MNSQKKINCPTCGKKNTWNTENVFRPFCSDRCKLIDLGEWASETRKIPGESVSDYSSEIDKSPNHSDDF